MFPLYDDNPHRRAPVVVVLFLLINFGVLIYALMLPGDGGLNRLAYEWGFVPAALWNGPYPHAALAVVTSMFIHGGWVHLLFNSWFFWIFGNNIEDRLGHLRFIVFYLLSGVGAVALHMAFMPRSADPLVGASGAISGVVGAYMRFFPMAPIYSYVPPMWIFPVPAFVFSLLWFALQFRAGLGSVFGLGQRSDIAFWAHVGGFIAGFLLAGAMRPGAAKQLR